MSYSRGKALSRKRAVTKRAEISIRRAVKRAFTQAIGQAKRHATTPDSADASKLAKADSEWTPDWSFLEEELTPIYEQVFASGAAEAAAQVKEMGVSIGASFSNEMRARAKTWSETHAGKLIKDISKTTRDDVAAAVASGLEAGLSADELASKLSESFAFSDKRAELIARTEVAFADVQANLAAYTEAGVELKQWITAADQKVSDECKANEDQGPIPIGSLFLDGSDGPPAHPNCRCDIVPVLKD